MGDEFTQTSGLKIALDCALGLFKCGASPKQAMGMGSGTSIRKLDGPATAGEGVCSDVGAFSRNARYSSRIFHNPPPERRLAAGFSWSDTQSRSQTGAPPSRNMRRTSPRPPASKTRMPPRSKPLWRTLPGWRPCGIKCNWPPNRRSRGAPPAWPASANHSSCPPTGPCGDEKSALECGDMSPLSIEATCRLEPKRGRVCARGARTRLGDDGNLTCRAEIT
jgi:hypothetical protein